MNAKLLVRHPAQFPTESVLGYVLRLSEENGYQSPWGIYHLSGLSPSQSHTRSLVLEGLAMITNRDSHNAKVLGERNAAGNAAEEFLLPDSGSNQTKFCPQCVEQMGFIEAQWDLPMFIGCPTHRCAALYRCPECKGKLSWYRPRLLQCKCGADLRHNGLLSLGVAEASLMNLIRNKVTGVQIAEGNHAFLPIFDLASMDLSTLWLVLKTLARYRMSIDGCYKLREEAEVVKAASRVLEHWPNNFVQLLSDVARRIKLASVRSTVAAFNKSFTRLFNSPMLVASQTDFLHAIIVEYSLNEWQYADTKLVEKFKIRLPTGLLPRHQPSASAITRLRNASADESLAERDAAIYLGVPRSVLRMLRETDEIQVGKCTPCEAKVHKSDLDTLMRRFLALAASTLCPIAIGETCIPLHSALQWRWDGPDIKAGLLAAILEHRVKVVGKTDESIGGLLLDRAEYLKCIQAMRDIRPRVTQSTRQAAATLRCNLDAIGGLLHADFLRGNDAPGGLEIESESLQLFQQRFVFLRSIAKANHCTSARLVRMCQKSEIPVKWTGIGTKHGSQSFIRVSDVERLSQILTESAISI